ncbi:LSM-domain-containing protein [Ramicandelaber brevisporus]|nr:LSM-domain-containing protein [Ramicandelaber brevisporus]
MARSALPELNTYLSKRILLHLNSNRRISGVLRGFDPYMNVVVDETVEEISASERNPLGMVVVRGNSIVLFEAIDPIQPSSTQTSRLR